MISLSIIIVLVKTHTFNNKTDLQYVCPWHTNNRRQNRTANTAAMFSAHTKPEELLLLSFFPLEPFVGKLSSGFTSCDALCEEFCFSSLVSETFMHCYPTQQKHIQLFEIYKAAAVAQWVRTITLQAKRFVFESQQRQTVVAKTGSDCSTAKRSAIRVSVTGPRR